ncbi:MAG: DUF3021 domain-containing protein [Clostridia bacterium]|nr:DUF3021 domain-containing protein [Clostridia bacterium]
MNKYAKQFLLRGMAFGGFGPVVAGIVFLSLDASLPDFYLMGTEVFLAILSTYALAFLQAGASVFNQIEDWPIPKCVFFHFLTIYVTYVGTYLINAWLPFSWVAVGIFTALFAIVYLVIWLSVYLSLRAIGNKMNRKLAK